MNNMKYSIKTSPVGTNKLFFVDITYPTVIIFFRQEKQEFAIIGVC